MRKKMTLKLLIMGLTRKEYHPLMRNFFEIKREQRRLRIQAFKSQLLTVKIKIKTTILNAVRICFLKACIWLRTGNWED